MASFVAIFRLTTRPLGMQSLLDKANLLHADISFGNMVFDDPATIDDARMDAWLIDLDNACAPAEQQPVGRLNYEKAVMKPLSFDVRVLCLFIVITLIRETAVSKTRHCICICVATYSIPELTLLPGYGAIHGRRYNGPRFGSPHSARCMASGLLSPTSLIVIVGRKCVLCAIPLLLDLQWSSH
jgi:hypothetical protein